MRNNVTLYTSEFSKLTFSVDGVAIDSLSFSTFLEAPSEYSSLSAVTNKLLPSFSPKSVLRSN